MLQAPSFAQHPVDGADFICFAAGDGGLSKLIYPPSSTASAS